MGKRLTTYQYLGRAFDELIKARTVAVNDDEQGEVQMLIEDVVRLRREMSSKKLEDLRA